MVSPGTKKKVLVHAFVFEAGLTCVDERVVSKCWFVVFVKGVDVCWGPILREIICRYITFLQ